MNIAKPEVKKRKSGKRCVIQSCLRSCRDGSDEFPVRMFCFPKDEYYRRKWLQQCNLFDDNFGQKTFYICDRHFEIKFFGKKKLLANAIPTLNLFDNTSLRSDSAVAEENYEIVCDGTRWEISFI